MAETAIRRDTEELLTLLASEGHAAYFGEQVTILEHSLQCAWFAEQAGGSAELVASALLHDVGHLLHGLPETVAAEGHDTRHEELAASFLAPWFGPSVIDPIRMHVAAKRYLCATEPGYFDLLSASSVQSLALQGGPMSEAEVRAFEAMPHAREAALLRRWDDEAKLVDFAVPELGHYRDRLRTASRAGV